MRKRLFSLVILVIGIPLAAIAASGFATVGLKNIADRLPGFRIDTFSQGTYPGYLWNDQTVVVRVNKYDEVEHIGFRLFSDQVRIEQGSFIPDFLERYFLELAINGREEAENRMRMDHVTFETGGFDSFLSLNGTEDVDITCLIFRGYRVSWIVQENEVLSISFPMDYQMMAGCNAIELEENFLRDINRYHFNSDDFPQLDYPDFNDTLLGRYYVIEGEQYLCNVIRNDFFLVRDSSFWRPVCGKYKPYWTSCNMAVSEHPIGNFILDVTLDKYGYTTENFSIPLNEFIAWGKSEGGKAYFGISSRDSLYIHGTMFMPFEEKGVCHMLVMKIPLTAICEKGGNIYGRLYVNIPQHNLYNSSVYEFKKISRKVKYEKK